MKQHKIINAHKLLDKKSRADSLKARHILIAYKGAYRTEPNIKLTKNEKDFIPYGSVCYEFCHDVVQ